MCKFCHQASTVHIQQLTVVPAEIKVTEPTTWKQSESDVKESTINQFVLHIVILLLALYPATVLASSTSLNVGGERIRRKQSNSLKCPAYVK